MIEVPGHSSCVSIEAGDGSLISQGRAAPDTNRRKDSGERAARLAPALRTPPFLPAKPCATAGDDPALVTAWPDRPRGGGVRANAPLLLCPYPGSPNDHRLFGAPDEAARAHTHARSLDAVARICGIQDAATRPFRALEAACGR